MLIYIWQSYLSAQIQKLPLLIRQLRIRLFKLTVKRLPAAEAFYMYLWGLSEGSSVMKIPQKTFRKLLKFEENGLQRQAKFLNDISCILIFKLNLAFATILQCLYYFGLLGHPRLVDYCTRL